MSDQVAYACSYPFEIPKSSYVFDPRTGTVEPTTNEAHHHAVDRVPVLAVGSNAAPSQLRKKFPPDSVYADPIPVLRVRVEGLDVVYAARVSRYGAIPATPFLVPDVAVHIHVTLLTHGQLERMNETESVGIGYELVELLKVDPPSSLSLREPLRSYVAMSGAIAVDGEPVSLDSVPAVGRRYRSWPETKMLDYAATLLGFDIESFVTSVTQVDGFQSEANERLRLYGIKR